MAKKLFKNYSYSFDSNETKILTTFCKQVLKQLSSDEKYYREIKVFQSILEKLQEGNEETKLTKDESTRLSLNLKENVKNIEKQVDKSWFVKKWLLKSMLKQYKSILLTHFSD